MTTSMRAIAARLDPVDPPQSLRGSATEEDLDWYTVRPRYRVTISFLGREYTGVVRTFENLPITIRVPFNDFDDIRRAGGTVTRIDDTPTVHDAMRDCTRLPIGLVQQRQKGISQLTRGISGQISFREITDRHAGDEAIQHEFLWYNTYLINNVTGWGDAPEYQERRDELGRAINKANFDIIGLCEVYHDDEVDAIRNKITRYTNEHTDPERNVGINSGLMTVTAGRGRFIPAGSDSSPEPMEFTERGEAPDSLSDKGVMYTEIDVGPGKIDLFITHLYAQQDSDDHVVRKKQLAELRQYVANTAKPENITLVAGDFNIDGRVREYATLLRVMYEPLRLQDLWLTHGSRVGSTHKISAFQRVCSFGATDPSYCGDAVDPGLSSDDHVPGYRLDYIFLEPPRREHSFNLDVGRVRRRPFWRGPPFRRDRFETSDELGFLSDHLGLEVTLYTSPKR